MQTERRFMLPVTLDSVLGPAGPALDPMDLIQQQIKAKFNIFVNCDVKGQFRTRRSSRLSKRDEGRGQIQRIDVFNAMLRFMNDLKKKQQRNKNKRMARLYVNEEQLRTQREKFKKTSNPLQFIQFYKSQHRFQPNPDQQLLIDKLVQLKALIESMQTIDLDTVLEQIYKLMNMAVDCNEIKLLIVTVVLSAEISLESKDLKRAFYFFDQARIASIFSGVYEVTIQSLIGMAKIAFQLGMFGPSIVFIKKALAYSWYIGDNDSEMEIYDILGRNYCEQGEMHKANYYHERFANSQAESPDSYIRKMYIDLIKEDSKSRNLRLYTENLDLLFLETLNLPIYNFEQLPGTKCSRVYENYVNQASPRVKITNKVFSYQKLPDVETQINKMLQQKEFKTEMPHPDFQPNRPESTRYGKRLRRNKEFSKTIQFHEITGKKMPTSSPKINRKYSLDKKLQVILADKPDPNWFEKMSRQVKYERLTRTGDLKNPVQRSHLSTDNRRRSLSGHSEKIRTSVNKAILNWIDPLQ